MSLLGFLKSTSSIGYAVTESMHQLILMLGNPQCHVPLAWTIGAEDDASIKSSVYTGSDIRMRSGDKTRLH